MSETDIQQGKQLLQEDFIKANPKCEVSSARARFTMSASHVRTRAVRWVKELELMLETREKAEIRTFVAAL